MKFIIFSLLTLFCLSAFTEDWQTRAELTQFAETSRYPEVIEYCKRLETASPWVRFTSFGKSPQGRELPLLIVSPDGIFTPDEAHRKDSLIFFVINGIHAGEIAGKEASLMLVRDIAIKKEKADLLKNIVLLVIPIYNVDGHERFGAYNRINQNGPKEMGWRTTSVNLNLNRDWLKADQTETRAMLHLIQSWRPDFMMDNHVTDGADFQYDVMHIFEDSDALAAPIRNFLKKEYEPFILNFLTQKGHKPTFYFEPVDAENPAAGIQSGPGLPRFSNGYANLLDRPLIVAETHMLKTFETRIRSHYDLMEASLRVLTDQKEVFRKAISFAEADTIQIARNKQPFPLEIELDTKSSTATKFLGIEYQRKKSPISGDMALTYGTKPVETSIPWFRTNRTKISIIPPLGYIIPPQWTFVKERFQIHGIRFQSLKKDMTGRFETYRFQDVTWEPPFEGRHQPKFKTIPVSEERTLPADSLVVWLNQPSNKIILHLLEPGSPDSLVSWGFFNAIFEQKEYAENYVLEKLASEMLNRDAALRAKFEERLKDPKFAANPSARLNFFYQNSPYWDSWKDAYPVVRITNANQIPQGSVE